jgi:hypothetical protein
MKLAMLGRDYMLAGMGSEPARRRPERRRVLVSLLRRIAIGAVLASLALWIGPRLLVEAGVLGPSPEERIEAGERTLRAAESYGATPTTPSYAEAKLGLQAARGALAQGRKREARQAAVRAAALAIEAQRNALLEAEQRRRRAEAVVKDLDARVNALEDRFDQVTPALPKPAVSSLLTSMKEARQAAGAVFLAWEKGQPERVLESEASARAAVEAAARGLDQAARPDRR